MADTYFSDWESLTSAVDQRARDILTKDVAPVAEDILKHHIRTDIYDAYTPIENGWVNHETYQRRHVLEDSIASIMQSYNTLLVTSTATASKAVVPGWSFHNRRPGSFLQLLESGNMGIWRHGFPRPAVSNTQKTIDTTTAVPNAIKRGIKREIGKFIEL